LSVGFLPVGFGAKVPFLPYSAPRGCVPAVPGSAASRLVVGSLPVGLAATSRLVVGFLPVGLAATSRLVVGSLPVGFGADVSVLPFPAPRGCVPAVPEGELGGRSFAGAQPRTTQISAASPPPTPAQSSAESRPERQLGRPREDVLQRLAQKAACVRQDRHPLFRQQRPCDI